MNIKEGFIEVDSFFLDSLVSLFHDGELDAAFLGEGNEGLLALADDKDVSESCGELVAAFISDVSNVEGTWVLLNVREGTDSTDVVSSCQDNSAAVFEFYVCVDFSSLEIEL